MYVENFAQLTSFDVWNPLELEVLSILESSYFDEMIMGDNDGKE